ncbi:MAG: hypothetical protein J6S74_02250 [Alphaproteobacteria bacterium]|nr:hypothetical protein [Alphaproteobacteria bacterium]
MIDFSKDWFENLEKQIRNLGVDSDAQSFDEIKSNLANPKKFNPTKFADMCAYVILAGGFSQKTAKTIHAKITDVLHKNGANYDTLISLFHNKNKISAICKIWNDKDALCREYYGIDDLDKKINYLSKLPHIGKITANHLARNLGENVVKYDVWIQRLGVVFAQQKQNPECKVHSADIDNGKLNPKIKLACDEMFEHLHQETNLPIGYIDVVLWKALQTGLIKL